MIDDPSGFRQDFEIREVLIIQEDDEGGERILDDFESTTPWFIMLFDSDHPTFMRAPKEHKKKSARRGGVPPTRTRLLWVPGEGRTPPMANSHIGYLYHSISFPRGWGQAASDAFLHRDASLVNVSIMRLYSSSREARIINDSLSLPP